MEPNLEALKRRYKDELMRYASSQTKIARPANTTPQGIADNGADERPMVPNRRTNQPQAMQPVLPGDQEEGYLIVQVSALQGAVPIPGADVVVTRDIGNETYLMWYDRTDASGRSRKFTLPAPPKAMSEQPSNGVPYALYNIRVAAPGFYTVTNLDSQIFSGETAIAAVDMLPKRESQENMDENITYTTPPSHLLGS